MIRLFLLIFLNSALLPLFGQNTEYLIIENPAEFVIYNKYQQKLKPAEMESFANYTPFKVINSDEMLSDQITPATRCSFENEIYFVIKNEDNKYLSQNTDAYIDSFKNCETIGDTIQVLRSDKIELKSKPKRTRSSVLLHSANEDELIVRVFRSQGVYFLKSLSSPIKYGWAVLLPDGSWKIHVPEHVKSSIISDRITERIQTLIASINRRYQEYFAYFNNKYNEHKPVPGWKIETSETSIHGTLSEPQLISKLEESTADLLQDLENIILGTGLTIDRTSDGFIIQEKHVQ